MGTLVLGGCSSRKKTVRKWYRPIVKGSAILWILLSGQKTGVYCIYIYHIYIYMYYYIYIIDIYIYIYNSNINNKQSLGS
jgi:hypothetical protein